MAVILVVDDSPVDRTRAGGLLKKRAGLTPAFAANGREALEAIAAQPPDLVLTDLQMPEIDGLELVETVRRRFPSLPVILMTAHGSEEIAVQALRKGAASYVAKRNLAAELVDTVLSVLEIARADLSQKHILACLTQTESRYELDNDIASIAPLIGQLEANLNRMELCDETGLIRVAVALREALVNAIYHGNLDLTSALLESDEAKFAELASRRPREDPYARRRVHLLARETRSEVTYVIRDEGQGFDPASLPDPTLPQNLELRTGRGLFLIRTFMDEVSHNLVGNEITMVKRRDHAPAAVASSSGGGGGAGAGEPVTDGEGPDVVA
jgi:CheY-like chemotaxis protein/anti-sigma regulatory factor (Ser/Thr protein kinase)